MNKNEFVSLIAEKGSITKVEAEKQVNNVIDAIIIFKIKEVMQENKKDHYLI